MALRVFIRNAHASILLVHHDETIRPGSLMCSHRRDMPNAAARGRVTKKLTRRAWADFSEGNKDCGGFEDMFRVDYWSALNDAGLTAAATQTAIAVRLHLSKAHPTAPAAFPRIRKLLAVVT